MLGIPLLSDKEKIWKKQARLAERSAETSPRTIMALATAVIAVACCNVFWLALKRTENQELLFCSILKSEDSTWPHPCSCRSLSICWQPVTLQKCQKWENMRKCQVGEWCTMMYIVRDLFILSAFYWNPVSGASSAVLWATAPITAASLQQVFWFSLDDAAEISAWFLPQLNVLYYKVSEKVRKERYKCSIFTCALTSVGLKALSFGQVVQHGGLWKCSCCIGTWNQMVSNSINIQQLKRCKMMQLQRTLSWSLEILPVHTQDWSKCDRPFPSQASYLLHLSSLYRSKAFVNGSIRLPDARTGWGWWHRCDIVGIYDNVTVKMFYQCFIST